MQLSEYNLTQDEIDTLIQLYNVGKYYPGSNDKNYESLVKKGIAICQPGDFGDEYYTLSAKGKAVAEQLKNDYTDNSTWS